MTVNCLDFWKGWYIDVLNAISSPLTPYFNSVPASIASFALKEKEGEPEIVTVPDYNTHQSKIMKNKYNF